MTEQINVVNRDLRKEKKVANALLETRRKEYAEVLTTNKALICDTQTTKKTIDDIKAKEKVDRLTVEREVRIFYSKKLKHANEKVAREKKENKELVNNKLVMEERRKGLMKELKNLKKIISTEVCKGDELKNKLFLEEKKYYNEKDKRHDDRKKRSDSNIKASNKLKDKEEEIARLDQMLFDMSDEVSGMKKESRKAYNEKYKMEIALGKKRMTIPSY